MTLQSTKTQTKGLSDKCLCVYDKKNPNIVNNVNRQQKAHRVDIKTLNKRSMILNTIT